MASQQDDEEQAEMLRWRRLHQESLVTGPQARATIGIKERSRLASKMQVHKDHERYGNTSKTLVYFTRPIDANKQEPQRKRGKQRTRLKLRSDEVIQCMSQALPSRIRRRSVICWYLPPAVAFSLFMFMLSNGFGVGLMVPTSAQEFSQQQQQEPLAQPLIYKMLHEPGSGSGDLGLASFARTSSSLSSSSSGSSGSQDQTYASTSAADVSPSLIEARCWNNYENDNECKQLNVITAPEGERQRHQNQHDDNIITPVVIFEASSTVEPAEGHDSNEISQPGLRPVFMATPYQSGRGDNEKADSLPPKRTHQIAKSNNNNNEGDDFYAQTTATTSSPKDGGPAAPVTRPSVFHFVATPQPKTTTSMTSKRPKAKTTTLGRRCRDENDADCDEPEENLMQQLNHSAPSTPDENDDSEDDDAGENGDQSTADGSSTSSMSNSAIEIGSGGGISSPTNDDNDDNDDSTDDGDDGESSGSNSIQEQNASNSGGDEFARSTEDGRLLVVTSIYPNKQPSATSAPDSGLTSTRATISTPAPTTRRPQNGAAEIEVVVHSTLPPSFPLGHRDHHKTQSTSEASLDLEETFVGSSSQTDSSATTTTTPMPDDTVTSKPIFPSSTMQSQPANQLDESEGGEAATAQQGPTATTTEVDLYTFRPIPIPVEQPLEPRPSNVVAASSSEPQDSNKLQATHVKQEVSSQHIHHDHSQAAGYRNSFDGWTTRKPSSYLLGLNKDQQQQSGQLPDVILGPNSIRGSGGTKGGAHGHLGTEMLPTMLLYASVIILLFISLIFVIVAYGFWRRNNLRRQTLLAKTQMLNGAASALPGHMIESMSHASHLMHGGGMAPPQGLLSTYAPGKGLTMGKVTTSLAKPPGQAGMMLGEDEEEEDPHQQQQQQVFKSNSKDQLVEGDEGEVEDGEQESLLDDQNQQQHSSTRNSRPANSIANRNLQNQSGSWSTDQDPTTTSSESQRTQDSQHHHNQQQMQQSSNQRHHYPNSLSDGRQNSSSISDSQCSPDPGPSGTSNGNHHLQQQQPIMGPNAQNHQVRPSSLQHHELNMMPNAPPQRQFGPQQQRPIYRPTGSNGGAMQQPMGPIAMQPPNPHGLRQPFYPMMMQNGNLMKQRLIMSRSIEDIQPSQHVGFVESTNNNSPHVPYLPPQPQQQPQILPQLVQARPHYQQYHHHQHLAGASQMHNSMISPQRIAMNPLATLGRRYPPGVMLNRNIYSEDSSSFMTTSPSLARTSSSSSFAFNISNLPTPSSIKAKPILDASGRLVNDYTANFNGTPVGGGESNGDRTNGGPLPPGAPPVFGRSDRSEAWYV